MDVEHDSVVDYAIADYSAMFSTSFDTSGDGFQNYYKDLSDRFPLGQVILDEEAEKAFIRLFGTILRLRNVLSSFDDFESDDPMPRARSPRPAPR